MSTAAIEEEAEILVSIYPDEFEKINEDTFKIRIDLDADECRCKQPPQLGPTYPDDAPYLTLDTALPDAEDDNEPEDFTSEDKSALLQALSDIVQESLGMAMIFNLSSALKEQAEARLAARQAERERQVRLVQQEVERQEQKKFEGTAVTPASFAAWRARFQAEMRKKEIEAEELALKRAGPNAPVRKLTGRQMFEGDRTLATSDAAFEIVS
ncbi:hypothetical protein BCR37DRAFT_394652 [Protomyces lactucae-debilis]|uniref:RWD domain-containing protein n=1 Tax=Protomyces lactucae-debilis TaxID=2754530 RepID=A0A1Y2F2P1_PROLT|nr:uncharacterized protein BCR37DRAFT_394652 [Protomyces lactucae-debilis]ORY78141.1 hypothetical protein BCR37DRAFT_394652 [Protomyces lactucae-debilis]